MRPILAAYLEALAEFRVSLEIRCLPWLTPPCSTWGLIFAGGDIVIIPLQSFHLRCMLNFWQIKFSLINYAKNKEMSPQKRLAALHSSSSTICKIQSMSVSRDAGKEDHNKKGWASIGRYFVFRAWAVGPILALWFLIKPAVHVWIFAHRCFVVISTQFDDLANLQCRCLWLFQKFNEETLVKQKK